MKFTDFRKSCIFMPKGRFEPSRHSLCVLSLYVPGNGCNGCVTEMCAKAQNRYKAQLLFEVFSQEWSPYQKLK